MSEEKEKNSEVLLEKVREIEAVKPIDKIEDKENTAQILNEKRDLSAPMSDAEARKLMGKHSRRSFLFIGAAAIAGYLGYRYLPLPEKEEVFKRAFKFNEDVSQLAFENTDLAPEFSPELASARANGDIGLTGEFDAQAWRLQVVGSANQTGETLLTLDDIKSLPRIEMTTELKCIEGWSIICNWTGARFSDFAAKFAAPPNTKYVSLVTPDGGYYVGWDMPSILHPQTLLAYEMNGSPLTAIHGAPLRLATATKYGIKQIKRIGRIEFTNERPADYWAERGYDWYSGH